MFRHDIRFFHSNRLFIRKDNSNCAGLYHLILAEERLFLVAPLRALWSGGIFPPRCAPLRALARGYDYLALRAMSLRDGIPLTDNDIRFQSIPSFVYTRVASIVINHLCLQQRYFHLLSYSHTILPTSAKWF